MQKVAENAVREIDWKEYYEKRKKKIQTKCKKIETKRLQDLLQLIQRARKRKLFKKDIGYGIESSTAVAYNYFGKIERWKVAAKTGIE